MARGVMECGVWRHALTQQRTTQAMLCPQDHVHSMAVLVQGVSCTPTDLQLCGCAVMRVRNHAGVQPCSFCGLQLLVLSGLQH